MAAVAAAGAPKQPLQLQWRCRSALAASLPLVALHCWRLSGRGRRAAVAARATSPTKASDEEANDNVATALEIAKSILLALLDIFSGPPKEATGKDAPGLAVLAPGGVLAALSGCEVLAAKNGEACDASKLVSPDAAGSRKTILLFLTHFGDFNSWELAQQVRVALRDERVGGARVVAVGIGSVESAKKFAGFLDLPESLELYADPKGACHAALGFSRGALPQYAEQLNPYVRVFLMLLGVGSPGTIRTVLGGYFGDTSLAPERVAWVDEALKQGAQQGRFPTKVPQRLPWEATKEGEEEWADLSVAGSKVWDDRGFGETGLRPFELATVRLQNMVSGIIGNWGDLKPEDDELLVQQGGAVVLDDKGEAVYFYRDKGILTYVPLEDALVAARG